MTRKRFEIVLRICPRARNSAHIDDEADLRSDSKSMNSPIGRVEWPMVKNGNAMSVTVLSNSRPAFSRDVSTPQPCARRCDRSCRS
jgi:hypothetical protein